MKEIDDLLQQYKTAVFEKDIAAYAAVYHEDVQIFDLWMQWTYNGLEEWLGMAKEWFDSLGNNRDAVNFGDVRIELGADMAFVTALVKFAAISETGEELRYLQNRLTWVVSKKNDKWKVIHQHTSSPVNFETLQVILKNE